MTPLDFTLQYTKHLRVKTSEFDDEMIQFYLDDVMVFGLYADTLRNILKTIKREKREKDKRKNQ